LLSGLLAVSVAVTGCTGSERPVESVDERAETEAERLDVCASYTAVVSDLVDKLGPLRQAEKGAQCEHWVFRTYAAVVASAAVLSLVRGKFTVAQGTHPTMIQRVRLFSGWLGKAAWAIVGVLTVAEAAELLGFYSGLCDVAAVTYTGAAEDERQRVTAVTICSQYHIIGQQCGTVMERALQDLGVLGGGATWQEYCERECAALGSELCPTGSNPQPENASPDQPAAAGSADSSSTGGV
jgi:hypothetical protein